MKSFRIAVIPGDGIGKEVNAVLHRPDRGDVARGASEHLFGRETDFLDYLLAIGPAFLADRDDRGFVEHDALAAHVDQRVRRAQIDGEIVVKVTAQETEHKLFRLKGILMLPEASI